MGIHHFETSTTASWQRSLDRKRPLGYHSNSYSWKGKERTPPFGQTARVCTGKQTNLGFSEGILPRQLELSFFDGEVNVNFEWSTLYALGRRTKYAASAIVASMRVSQTNSLLATWRRAVRCAAGSGYHDNVAPLVKQLNIVSLEHRWAMQVAEIVFCCNHGSAPSALEDKIRRNNHGARTRGFKESCLPYRFSFSGELS